MVNINVPNVGIAKWLSEVAMVAEAEETQGLKLKKDFTFEEDVPTAAYLIWQLC